ncbi:hypothetical protein BST33_00150 [Mycolicibacter minnesotensis]|uniref:Uncharacterized protein n=2 Tax=Mycolicibacter minnesotensis TaxID=1118379 RepID=A0A7I7R8B9_9MYCO|nr:hypothetical protein BST33_00150 [Mycolicibacter minnesotensis]BBY34929.1 hypothetical protein MMIN_29900 [Mycolicibacter minnesotensis]
MYAKENYKSEQFPGADGYSPMGSSLDKKVTYTETDPLLVEALRHYFENDPWTSIPGKPSFTVYGCWSGCSEYTITSEWDEIEVVWGKHRRVWDSMSQFFSDLADAHQDVR